MTIYSQNIDLLFLKLLIYIILLNGTIHLGNFICEFKKQNTFKIHWLWFIFPFLRSFFKKVADRLSDCFIKRNHVSIWNWNQKYNPQKYPQ